MSFVDLFFKHEIFFYIFFYMDMMSCLVIQSDFLLCIWDETHSKYCYTIWS